MTDKQIIINGIDVSKCNFRLERDNQQKCECCHATGFGVICDCEKWHNCYFKQLARAKEEYEKLKYQNEILNKKLKPKLKNAHCVYFEGQTGLCRAKEFVKCNPVNCELYTIDELSTILDLQEQLKHKEQECENLKEKIAQIKCEEIGKETFFEYKIKNYKQALDEIEKTANKNFTHTSWKEYEEQLMQILDIINKAKEK